MPFRTCTDYPSPPASADLSLQGTPSGRSGNNCPIWGLSTWGDVEGIGGGEGTVSPQINWSTPTNTNAQQITQPAPGTYRRHARTKRVGLPSFSSLRTCRSPWWIWASFWCGRIDHGHRGLRPDQHETAAAAAGIGGVGIVEDESTPHDLILEIDFGPVEIEIALGIAHDLEMEIFDSSSPPSVKLKSQSSSLSLVCSVRSSR